MEPGRESAYTDHAAHDAAHDGPHDADTAHDDESSRFTVLDAEPHAEGTQAVKLPTHSTRGSAPGLRGCWALNRDGDPCGAARRADGDYCNAHSGIGVAEDPAKWAPLAAEARSRNARRASMLRMQLGITRSSTPRGVLKALAFVESERIASRIVDGVLSDEVPSDRAARLGLDLLDAIDPRVEIEVSGPLPTTPEGVAGLSLSQLLAAGQQLGIEASLDQG